MPNELEVTRNNLNYSLSGALNNAASIITKDYLSRLESCEIVPPSAEDADIDIAECGKFYQLTKLVLNKEESFLKKLTTIVNVASSLNCSAATVIKSDGSKIDYYVGIISKTARSQSTAHRQRRHADAAAFKGALLGNLIGSELRELSADDIVTFKEEVLAKQGHCCSAVSGLVSLRDEDDKTMEGYVQGLENLVDSLKGLKYAIVMLADPVDTAKLQAIRQGYELMHTQLATFAGSSVTFSESDTLSLSKAQTDGVSAGIAKGIALTQGRNSARGYSSGFSASAGISFIVSANVGFNAGTNWSSGESSGRTESGSETSQRSRAVTNTSSSAKTAGKSLQLNYENRSVKALLDKIDRHLERLDECESFGAFDCAAYVIADDRETALTAAGSYNALMRGQNSCVQASHINSWHKPDETALLNGYLGSLVHPRFYLNKSAGIIVTPASLVSGGELAIQFGLPKKSVAGITVLPMAPFGRNVAESTAETVELGALYHMGHAEGGSGRHHKVRLDLQSLAMHTFVTGSTGKGKSTAIYGLLDKLITHKVRGQNRNVKFLVIEPAKGEYKNRFGGYPNVSVYGTNSQKTPLLRINPFSFPADIHVLEHIDRLIEIFNVCWPMYAAMPAVLKDAVEQAYTAAGWNLSASECRYKDSRGQPLYPSFADVLQQIHAVMNDSAYSADSKGDYKGALCTRVKSLTNGLYGQIFVPDELPPQRLFEENAVVDLSRVGSSETKALIMGILVLKLQEYRLSEAAGGNAPLRHVTVLEEAHHLLKRTSTEQSSEGANLLGKAVEMLANAIAEMRTCGEGFIIADQAPGLMDLSVIRNTNTKIILGLPDLADRELAGRAAGLNDDQVTELARLPVFVAAVYQNNWLEPVLCEIEHNFKAAVPYRYAPAKQENSQADRVLQYLLMSPDRRNALDRRYVAGLIDEAYRMPWPASAKTALIRYTAAGSQEELLKLRQQAVYGIFNTETAFGLARYRENDIGSWYACLKDALEPSISALSDNAQRQIIALLAKEKADREGTAASAELFEHLMSIV